MPISEETKKKMSISHKGLNIWSKGKIVPIETRQKISISMKGKNTWMTNRKNHISKEAREKMRLNMLGNKYNPGIRGEKHYRWITDRSKLKIDTKKHLDTRYKYWMLEVKKRDSWKCRIADVNCGGRLEAHHILNWKEYPELRYDINNGITLCQAHHPRSRKKEAELTPYFKSLVLKI